MLAGLALGACAAEAPGPPPRAPAPWFEDVAAAAGVDFVYDSGQAGGFLFPEIMGGGVALLDLEGDGDLDLYFVQGGSLHGAGEAPPNRLWRNLLAEGGGTAARPELRFEEITAGSGADDRGYGMGVTVGDYDGDGDPDLYVTNVGPNVLLANRGDGVFEDVTATAGVGDGGWGASAAFLDSDRDGDLDLLVVNYVDWSLDTDRRCKGRGGGPDYCSPVSYQAPQPAVLYRNEGDGTFTDVSDRAGLRGAFGNGLGVVWGDFDGDEWPDVFVANDQTPNHLWRNLGAERPGLFEEIALAAGCAVDESGRAKAGMGVASADLDDDGDLDLLVANLQAQSDSLYLNQGGWFTDATARFGLALPGRQFTRFGVGLADFDNDGHLDLFETTGRVTLPNDRDPAADDPFAEPNLLLAGRAGGGFEPVAPAGGTAAALLATSRAAAFGDLDNDGGLDVVVVNRDAPAHVLRNVVPERGHWVRFRLVDANGAAALGARLDLRLGERRLRRDVAVAGSYLAANDPRIHVGLGSATVARDVTVTWADGCRETLGDVEADREKVLRHPPHDSDPS